MFYLREDRAEGDVLVCANAECKSEMVIEKNTNEIDVIDQQYDNSLPYEDDELNDTCDGNCDVSSSSKHDDSSIAIVIPSFKNDSDNPTPISSWPPRFQKKSM